MQHLCKYFVLLLGLKFTEGSFRCDYKYSTVAKGWFKHYVNPATWSDARLRCTLEGATLVSPTNKVIATEMKHIIKSSLTAESEVFTGIHATVSNGNFHTVEGIPLSKIPFPWAENEPDNKGNNESCITFNGNGKLSDRSCEETRPYICYRSGNLETKVNECGTIDSGYTLNSNTGSCYKFHTVPRTFSRAFLACSAEGGHLAIINSDAEAKALSDLFKKNPAGNMVGKFWKDVAFVGFHNWGEPFDWRTIHGQRLWDAGYGKFKGGEPNDSPPGENCGAIARDAKLMDLWCNRPTAFICEKRPDFPAICDETEVEENQEE